MAQHEGSFPKQTEPASPCADAEAVATVPFGQAAWLWLKLGFIGFGGPAGQIALLHTELVERRRWISERRFLHALNYCMLLPGPEATQMVSYMGWLLHRTWGAIVAGLLFVLPSFFILVGLSWIYLAWGHTPWVEGLFYGIKPAVTAIVLFAAHRIGARVLKSRWMWAIAISAFVAIFALGVPFPAIVVVAALIGWLGARYKPEAFAATSVPHSSSSTGAALIDDDSPRAAHTAFSRSHLIKVLLVGVGLWLAVMGALIAYQGWQGTLAQMGWFFTKAALVTFGGAYAVLPYVYQGAVDVHQWLSGPQMIDGLALGETTPGPLIMIVAFVGFVGGWQHAVLGPEWLWAGAALAAIVVTFFTFLPSFIFILAGAPLVEATHGKLGFTAPLTAITAAVVGAIFKLALFFVYHTWWPEGFEGAFDPVSMALTLVATWALFRLKLGMLPLIGLSAMSGLLVFALR